MSIKIMAAVWESGPQKQAERFVLLALADFANDRGECWPSIASIVAKTCLSERGVRQIIRSLEEGGWLETRLGGGRGGANVYRINPEPRAPFSEDKPGTACPPARGAPRHVIPKKGHEVPPPPARGAPEPSLNHQEPSEEPLCVSPAPKSRRRPEVSLPPNWVPSDKNIADAKSRNFTDQEISREADKFRDHHIARDNRFRDWDAAWRTWIVKSREFEGRRMAGPSNPGNGGGRSSIASIVARRRLEAEQGLPFDA